MKSRPIPFYFRWYINAVVKVVKIDKNTQTLGVKFIHWPVKWFNGKEFEIAYPFKEYKMREGGTSILLHFRPLTDFTTQSLPVSIIYKIDKELYQWIVIFEESNNNNNIVLEVI